MQSAAVPLSDIYFGWPMKTREESLSYNHTKRRRTYFVDSLFDSSTADPLTLVFLAAHHFLMGRPFKKYLHTWVDYQSVTKWKMKLHVVAAPILETFNLGLRFFTPQRRRRRKLLGKKFICFHSTTTLLWPISQRVKFSPRSSVIKSSLTQSYW